MPIQDAKSIVRDYYERVVSTGDIERLAQFISPDYAEVYRGVRHELGLAGAREHVLGVRRVFPDLRVEVGRQVAEGDWVASSITARGTHAGEWFGITSSGRVLEFTGVNLDRVVDGLIVEHGGAANLLEPLLKAGLLKPASTPSVD